MNKNIEFRCDLCEGTNHKKLHEWEVGNFWNPSSIPLTMWKCDTCELVCLYPVPLPEHLPNQGDWWAKKSEYRRNRRFKRLWEPMRRRLFGTSKSRLIKATRKVCPGGKLLDVGCGTGTLLDEAKPYFECYGLEPSPIAAKQCREKGYNVVEDYFENVTFENYFDAITMDSVIEHVASPTQFLIQVHGFLKPGGVVAILTPKYGGPASTRHGAGWNGFRHGYHTFLFSGKTLSALLEKTGFEVLSHPKRDRILDDILILWGRK